jgi:hypothetical protein
MARRWLQTGGLRGRGEGVSARPTTSFSRSQLCLLGAGPSWPVTAEGERSRPCRSGSVMPGATGTLAGRKGDAQPPRSSPQAAAPSRPRRPPRPRQRADALQQAAAARSSAREAGSDERHQGQPHLGHDQGLQGQPPLLAATGGRALLERRAEARTRHLQGGRQAEQHIGGQAASENDGAPPHPALGRRPHDHTPCAVARVPVQIQ